MVETDLTMPLELEEVFVSVTMSRTSEGNVCEPTTRHFPVNSRTNMPLRIRVERGDVYGAWLAYRVAGWRNGGEVIRAEGRVSWPDSGTTDVAVEMQRWCHRDYGGPPCAYGQQCAAGFCEDLSAPVGQFFDELVHRDRGMSCDRSADPEDVVDPPDGLDCDAGEGVDGSPD